MDDQERSLMHLRDCNLPNVEPLQLFRVWVDLCIIQLFFYNGKMHLHDRCTTDLLWYGVISLGELC